MLYFWFLSWQPAQLRLESFWAPGGPSSRRLSLPRSLQRLHQLITPILMATPPTLMLIATIPTLMAIIPTPIVITVIRTGVMVDGVIMVIGVRVTGVMADGVIMAIAVRVTGVMVEGVIMVLGVQVTGAMVGIADNIFFGQLRCKMMEPYPSPVSTTA